MKLKLLVLVLLTLVVAILNTSVWAASVPKKKGPPKEMTDAAGRVHVRPSGKITDAQRKAAARQRKARMHARTPKTTVTPGVR